MYRVLLMLMFSVLGVRHAASDELKVWIRAFIPNKHETNPGYVRTVPGAAGHWMIPAPSLGPLDKLAPADFNLDGDVCFSTDNRGFSDKQDLSARVTTAFRVTVDGIHKELHPLSGDSVHFSGQSTAYKCSTGAVLATKPGKVTGSVGGPHVAGGKTQVNFQAAGSLPFIALAFAIDYSGDVAFDKATKKMSFRFTCDRFPAYEGYAQLDDGPIKKIFSLSPSGDSVWTLLDLGTGIGQRSVSGEASF